MSGKQSEWLLGEKLWTDRDEAVHRLTLRDEHQRRLILQGGIWVLELSKLEITHVHSEQDRWLKFFIEGERLSQSADLPEWMQTQEMQQAMQTVKRFSDKQRAYFAYQARQNYLRHVMSATKISGCRPTASGAGFGGLRAEWTCAALLMGYPNIASTYQRPHLINKFDHITFSK